MQDIELAEEQLTPSKSDLHHATVVYDCSFWVSD